MKRGMIGLAAAAAACGAPGTADAGIFSATESTLGASWFGVDYIGLTGENSRVVASYDAATRTFTLTDTGALRVVPDPYTMASDTNAMDMCTFTRRSVTCQHPPRNEIITEILLEDGNDTLSLSSEGTTTWLDGGTGNDVIQHSGTAAHIDGGDGNDRLHGGDGDDALRGGAGADAIDGGAGTDTTPYGWVEDHEYMGATAGVRVTLDGLANDGMAGERDNVAGSVEHVIGSRYDDVLVGDAGAQLFDGFDGADRIEGGGGDDVLDGSAGDDRVDGGDGDDLLTGGDGDDHLIGGAGADAVHGYATYPISGASADDDLIEVRDGEADHYACGDGDDLVRADPFDSFGYRPPAWWTGDPNPTDDCETLEVLP